MYTYQELNQAVELYLKLSKSIGLKIGQLESPTKHALTACIHEYDSGHNFIPDTSALPSTVPSKGNWQLTLNYLESLPCIDPAVSSQLMLLRRMPPQGFACSAPDQGAGGYSTG
jgi:hypothetical protein